MKNIVIAMAIGLALGLFASGSAMAEEVTSLRGGHNLDANAEMFKKKRVVTQSGGFKRSWKLQPPSVPHKIDNDRINMQENTCMRCHSKANYEKEKAPKVADSHFVDAAGKMHKDLNMRRYFCTQCHMTQVNAKPLVENSFVGQ